MSNQRTDPDPLPIQPEPSREQCSNCTSWQPSAEKLSVCGRKERETHREFCCDWYRRRA